MNRLTSYRGRLHRLIKAWHGYDYEQLLKDERTRAETELHKVQQSHEEALHTTLHMGIAIGESRVKTIAVYEQRCAIHKLALERIAGGDFRCWVCHEIAVQQGQLTGPIKIQTGRLLQGYLKDGGRYATNFRLAAIEKPSEK